MSKHTSMDSSDNKLSSYHICISVFPLTTAQCLAVSSEVSVPFLVRFRLGFAAHAVMVSTALIQSYMLSSHVFPHLVTM